MKKLVLSVLLASSITLPFATVTHATGIPVVDGANLAQALINVQEAQKRFQQLKTQITSVTGNACLGGLISDPTDRSTLNKYLPQVYSDITQAVKNGDMGALQSVYKKVQENEKSLQGSGKARLATTMMVNQAQTENLLKNLDVRNAKIDSIVSQLNATTDLSSKADLANALSAENAQISNDMTRINILLKQGEIQQKLAEQQASKESVSKLIGR